MAAERFIGQEDFYALASTVLSRGDGLRFKAGGNSMFPFIRNGDTLVIQPYSEGHPLHSGDVLLCRLDSGQLVAHRLRLVQSGKLSLQGDACAFPDGWITPVDVLGRVVSVERNGKSHRPSSPLTQFWLQLAPFRPLLLHIYSFLRRQT